MKTCFILFIIYLSAHSVQGGLLFLHGSSVTLEGSTAFFICQETGEHLSTKLSWFFNNSSSHKVIADNGQLSLEFEKDKFKLLKAGTRLEITNITVNDGGNYGCIIRGENGEVLLSASALLNVKAGNESTENTLQEFLPSVPSIRPMLSDIIAPSPVHKTAEMMPRTVFYGAAHASLEGINPTTIRDNVSPCRNTSNNTADIAFLNDKISPDFIVVSEAEQIRLRCTYCAISPNATSLSWYKEGVLIANSSRYVLRNAELDIPVAEHSKDEGLYECIVKSKNQNISRFITLIVQKDELNPLLSSVYAKNKSYLSVQIMWRLTDHGTFTSALVTLSLRLLNSSNWRHATSDIFQDHGLYQFDGLQPKSAYLLNVSLYNRHKETESKALVFWSPTSNYSDLDSKLMILYQATNKKALGVALGIIGLLGLMMVMYACLAWSPSEKRGYSLPSEQQKKRTINESNNLFSTSNSLFYNRAFEDEGADWSKDQQCL